MENHLAHRVGQVRAVFSIAADAAQLLFGAVQPQMHLAYVDWFTPFCPHREPHHGMFKVSRCLHGNSRLASVVVASRIRQKHPSFSDRWSHTSGKMENGN
jgi:hypothetical protein